ncbi:unnamed protein product [Paramecium octaurelia]|uniref:non-specific serine/threonine protein kinase n=1 Tax=Paramecium octaurelia TaxID=43137 RepID=A0A8S1T0Z1_PAROT|nr:unnamed protein product [Paramecium octaurelia]
MQLIFLFLGLLFRIDCQDPNDAVFSQSINVVLNGQLKHYYVGNVVVHASSRQEKNEYFPEDSTTFDDDGTPEFIEYLEPYDYDQEIDLNDLRVSRIYPDVNRNQVLPYNIQQGNMSDYAVKKYLGDGTFAFVQSAIRLSDGLPVVLKQIKKEYTWWAKMEAKVLNTLNEESNPNIVRLVDAFFNDSSPVLVFQELQNCTTFDYRIYNYYHDLTSEDIKDLYFKLFQALATSHAKGIMHLDIKPANIIVNNDQIQLIDWGVSDFYFPMKEYRTRVGTRHYRAPEQLIHYKYYDYAVDVWALGSIFATAVFKKYPFFNGRNNDDQLLKVVKVLGSQDFFKFCDKYSISIPDDLHKKLQGHEKIPLETFINDENRELATPKAVDLLNKIFVYDHAFRITAEDILQHEYFTDL